MCPVCGLLQQLIFYLEREDEESPVVIVIARFLKKPVALIFLHL